jgi:hypothetical protein
MLDALDVPNIIAMDLELRLVEVTEYESLPRVYRRNLAFTGTIQPFKKLIYYLRVNINPAFFHRHSSEKSHISLLHHVSIKE